MCSGNDAVKFFFRRGVFKSVCSSRGGCEIGMCSGNDAVKMFFPAGVSVRTCVRGVVSVSMCVRGMVL